VKKILFVTGTRADFGKMKTLMHAVNNSKDFELLIFVTGMHMLNAYGSTYNEIEKEGFKNIFLFFNQIPSTSFLMEMALAETIRGLSHYANEFKPDLIIVHGDRIEAIAGALVGALSNILIAHIEGGELSGTVDDSLRHAVTKLAHIHFTANKDMKRRLMQLGEEKKNIFVIGSPNVDTMLNGNFKSVQDVKRHYAITYDRYFIFIYHPVLSELEILQSNISKVFDALIESGEQFILIHPNNDKGADYILESFKRVRNNRNFKIFPSLRFEYYLTLLKNSCGLVGNSSSGIHEAPVYGVPSINIGTRQSNRCQQDSIVNVPEDSGLILKALKNVTPTRCPCYYFGKGNSSMLFMKAIEEESFWRTNRQKKFIDIL
jgi:UDP-N-acetylglucosamine 2-epimerase (hydrolysing)